jgi:hypothetical protein
LRVSNEPYDALAAGTGVLPGLRVTTLITPPGPACAKRSGVEPR